MIVLVTAEQSGEELDDDFAAFLLCASNNRFIIVEGVIKVEGHSLDVIDRPEKLHWETF